MVQRRSLKGGPGSPQVQKLKTAAGWYFRVARGDKLLLWQLSELQQQLPAARYVGSNLKCTAGVMERPAAAPQHRKAQRAAAGGRGRRGTMQAGLCAWGVCPAGGRQRC